MLLHGPRQALLWLWRAVMEPTERSVTGVGASRGARRWAMLRDWVQRYGLAECGGVAGALLATFVVRHATTHAMMVAYAGAWGETIGYAGVIVTRDWVAHARHRVARADRPTSPRGLPDVLIGLLAEFGPAGAIDSLATRPLAMAAGVRLLGPVRGVILGKLAADTLFYIPVILTYEHRKRRRAT